MLKSIIVSRYSKAIFEIAKDKNSVDAFAEELESISVFLNNDKKIISFFEAPFVSLEKKRKIIHESFAGYREEILKFVEVLVQYRKIKVIADIYEAFDEMVHKSENKVPGKLTAAKRLSDSQVKKIEEKISKILNASVVLKQVEEKEVLGGFKVEVGSYVVDSTIKAQLDKFRKHSV